MYLQQQQISLGKGKDLPYVSRRHRTKVELQHHSVSNSALNGGERSKFRSGDSVTWKEEINKIDLIRGS